MDNRTHNTKSIIEVYNALRAKGITNLLASDNKDFLLDFFEVLGRGDFINDILVKTNYVDTSVLTGQGAEVLDLSVSVTDDADIPIVLAKIGSLPEATIESVEVFFGNTWVELVEDTDYEVEDDMEVGPLLSILNASLAEALTGITVGEYPVKVTFGGIGFPKVINFTLQVVDTG